MPAHGPSMWFDLLTVCQPQGSQTPRVAQGPRGKYSGEQGGEVGAASPFLSSLERHTLAYIGPPVTNLPRLKGRELKECHRISHLTSCS